ncbi:hypothetical protein [Kribbella sindirgiensis]|uniref:Uncharacterized protein n=1 Tax=Kribbella sindirgiensis TaxID=1124744 RepID=A0A4R0J5W2_9ACTN|nr:hypothetical protein [Kribbella sindirgiensis]TCC39726.1 hypothetical protein E0H50_07360 [Kribbella sindirgiensis]
MRLKTSMLVALTGALAATITAGTADARPAQEPLQWTTTATHRQPATFNDVATGAGGTWAVGGDQVDGFADQRPLAMRWDGKTWKATPQPVKTNASLESVAVGTAKNVWAVGEDRTNPDQPKPLALHYNGTKWQVVKTPAVPTGSFGDVVIAPDASVWVTGWANVGGKERAVVYRYAAGKWQALNTGLEGSINGNVLTVLSAKNAWLGLNAGLAHFDGERWTLVKDLPTDGSQIPTGMASAGPDNIWLVGVQYASGIAPLALHYNGAKWTKVAVPAGMAQLYDVALRNNLPVVVGERFADGQTATPYVLQLSGSKLVAAPAPKAATGTLTGITTTKDRVWTVGMSAASAQDPFAALAAFSR